MEIIHFNFAVELKTGVLEGTLVISTVKRWLTTQRTPTGKSVGNHMIGSQTRDQQINEGKYMRWRLLYAMNGLHLISIYSQENIWTFSKYFISVLVNGKNSISIIQNEGVYKM